MNINEIRRHTQLLSVGYYIVTELLETGTQCECSWDAKKEVMMCM